MRKSLPFTSRKEIVLSVLAAGLLAPSLALAFGRPTPRPRPTPTPAPAPAPVTLTPGGPSGTFAFQYQATSGSTLVASGQNAITASYGLIPFYHTLANDLKKGNKSCPDLSTVGQQVTKNAELVLPKISQTDGDTTYSEGVITGSGGQAVTGFAWFNGFSGAGGLGNAGLLNSSNSATAALLCGGNTSGGSTGECGNSFNCVAGELPNVKNPKTTDPTNEANCANAGSFVDSSTSASNEFTLRDFVYPLGGALCNKPQETLAECCHDKNLVIIVDVHETLINGGTQVLSTVADQGTGGRARAFKQ